MKAQVIAPTVYITINGKALDLKAEGLNPADLDFRYKENFRDDPVSIGTIDKLKDVVASVFKLAIDTNVIETELQKMKEVPFLGDMVDLILQTELILTEVVVSPKRGEYVLGVGVRTSKEKPLKLGVLEVDGFSVGIKITKNES